MVRDIPFILIIFIGLAIVAIPYLAFPVIRLIINHGRFAREQAKQIALWNSITLGALSLLLAVSVGGIWSIVPPFVYYWINLAILTDKSKTDADTDTPKNEPEQEPVQNYKCANCGKMGPYVGNCPVCGSEMIEFLDSSEEQ